MGLMVLVGRRFFPKVLWVVARTGSRELFTLAVISAAVGVAYLSAKLFSVSFALGAFFAGMMMRESALSHRAAEESLPLRDAFAVLFFVSVGMLFDPHILLQEPLKLLSVVGIVLLGKTVAAVALVLAFRYPLNTALTVGASLAQIGEFSFILAGLGVTLGLLPTEGRSLILAAALVSITLNPVMFAAIEPVQRWIRSRSSVARALERRDDPLAELPTAFDPESLTGHVVLVGYGRVGSRIAEALQKQGIAVRRRGAESGAGRAAAGAGHPRRVGRCGRAGGAGPGTRGSRGPAGGGHPGRPPGAEPGGDRADAQSQDRGPGTGAQRRGGGHAAPGGHRRGVHGRARARARHDAWSARPPGYGRAGAPSRDRTATARRRRAGLVARPPAPDVQLSGAIEVVWVSRSSTSRPASPCCKARPSRMRASPAPSETAETGLPLAGAAVALSDLSRTGTADTDGRYLLTDLPPGPQHISVRFIGYAPRVLHALVPSEGRLEIDVALRRDAAPVADDRGAPRGRRARDWRKTRSPTRTAPRRSRRSGTIRCLAEPDALGALEGGEVALAAESPNGMHVRGGAADQTAFELDGVPILSPYHAAGLFSAWNPDALAGVALRSSGLPGGESDALSGTVAGETRAPGAQFDVQGALTTTQARVTVAGPISAVRGGLLVSLRSGFRSGWPAGIGGEPEPALLRGGTGDRLVAVTLRTLGGRLRLLAYTNDNELSAAAHRAPRS